MSERAALGFFEEAASEDHPGAAATNLMMEHAARLGRWSLDIVAGRIAWSPGMARLYGRAMPEGGVLDLDEHVTCLHPDDRAAAFTFLRRLVAGELVGTDGYFSRRGRVKLPDNTVREVMIHGHRLCDAAGRPTRLEGMTIDVTEIAQSERLLRETTELLRTTLENIDQGLVNVGPDMRVRLHNRRANTLFQLPDDILYAGASLAAVSDYMAARGDYDQCENRLQALIEGDRTIPLAYERAAPGGGILEVRRNALADGGFVHTFADVTARRDAERDLLESERRFRLLAENSNDVVILSDLDLVRLYVSPAVRRMLGYEPVEFAAMRIRDCVHPDDDAICVALLEEIRRREKDHYAYCMRYRHKHGGWVWCEGSLRLARDPATGIAQHHVLTLRDVTARMEAEERIRHLALHDSLTGLPNRELFRERLAAALVGAGGEPRCAVLACDLDHFKAVNDTLGHPAGDVLLRIVTSHIVAHLRASDTFARLGGDEFAILLPDITAEAAVAMAERLIEAVGEPIALDGHHLGIGASIGIAVAAEGTNADELYRRADVALYQAKAAGRNACRLFEPSAQTLMVTRGQLALDMKDAVRRGDFRLVYQPLIDLDTGQVGSFEALMRWRHPSRGDIMPSDFISVAEETGMIVPLGVWALHTACREATRWPSSVKVAVNVSAVQFRREGLELQVVAALGQSGLSPHRLKLEVTESVLMQDSEAVIASLHRLRQLGVRIVLDDFGTGYSSLRYLRQFSFDKIKIDGSFVREIADPDAAAIVRAIVGIGERLGIGVTAEGVETEDQLERVRREGCTEVQGYYFSRPLEAKDARRYAATRRTRRIAVASS